MKFEVRNDGVKLPLTFFNEKLNKLVKHMNDKKLIAKKLKELILNQSVCKYRLRKKYLVLGRLGEK